MSFREVSLIELSLEVWWVQPVGKTSGNLGDHAQSPLSSPSIGRDPLGLWFARFRVYPGPAFLWPISSISGKRILNIFQHKSSFSWHAPYSSLATYDLSVAEEEIYLHDDSEWRAALIESGLSLGSTSGKYTEGARVHLNRSYITSRKRHVNVLFAKDHRFAYDWCNKLVYD